MMLNHMTSIRKSYRCHVQSKVHSYWAFASSTSDTAGAMQGLSPATIECYSNNFVVGTFGNVTFTRQDCVYPLSCMSKLQAKPTGAKAKTSHKPANLLYVALENGYDGGSYALAAYNLRPL